MQKVIANILTDIGIVMSHNCSGNSDFCITIPQKKYNIKKHLYVLTI